MKVVLSEGQTFAPPGPGHNHPPLASILSTSYVQNLIDEATAPLRLREAELVDSCKRFVLAYPVIETPEQDAKAAEVLAVVQRFTSASGRVETARVALKAPILAADAAIGSLKKGPFAKIAEAVDTAAAVVRRASLAYKQKVEAETRRKAQELANQKAAEAALAERLAASGRGLVTMEDAATASMAAEVHQRIADSKSANLTRSHGDGVGTTSLRYKRIATLIPGMEHLVPREFCTPSQSKIDMAKGRALDAMPTIPGVKFEDVPDLTVRR